MAKGKILIIDDDPDIINTYKIVLEGNDYEAVTFMEVPNDICALVKEHGPDLIILDIMFPEDSTAGFDMCRELKSDETLSAIPVVMATSVNQEYNMVFKNVKSSDSLPANQFLDKPIDPKQLLDIVAKELG